MNITIKIVSKRNELLIFGQLVLRVEYSRPRILDIYLGEIGTHQQIYVMFLVQLPSILQACIQQVTMLKSISGCTVRIQFSFSQDYR